MQVKGHWTFGILGLCWVAAVVLYFTPSAHGVERFPPPEFETTYQMPQTVLPGAARGEWIGYLDVGVLLGALILASVLIFRNRSRRAIWWLMLFSLAYFGFWRRGCICSIGAIQNVTLSIFDSGYLLPVMALVFFLAPLVVALFRGRVFCGAVCPLGAIQDLFVISPITVPGWVEQTLRLFAYLYLGLAVLFAATGSTFLICQYDPFVALFRLSGSLSMLMLGACILVIGLFVARPYCRYLCPYGVLLSWFSRVSKRTVSITPGECVQCRLCETSCPFGAIQSPYTAPPPEQDAAGKRRLVWILMVWPILVAVLGLAGYLTAPSLSRMHATVRLADRIYLEKNNLVEGSTDASDAFRTSGESVEELYQNTLAIGRQFRWGGILLGVFMGIVLGLKLIGSTIRRTRTSYQPDAGLCLACGRCYEYCPVPDPGKKFATNS